MGFASVKKKISRLLPTMILAAVFLAIPLACRKKNGDGRPRSTADQATAVVIPGGSQEMISPSYECEIKVRGQSFEGKVLVSPSYVLELGGLAVVRRK